MISLLLILFLIITKWTDLSILLCHNLPPGGWAPPGPGQCVTWEAVNQLDYSICHKIEKYFDYGYTGRYDYDDVWDCYAEVSATKLDLSVCDEIQIEDKKKECLNNFYFYHRINDCQDSKTQEEKGDKCFSELGIRSYNELGRRNKSFSICGMIKNEEGKDFCFRKLAQWSKDIFICGSIQDQDVRDSCYISLVTTKLDISDCSNITYSNYKYQCYLNIALEQSNSSVCVYIEDETFKWRCYIDVAIKKLDPLICENIIDESNKDLCYRWVAEEIPDISICDLIQSQRTKTSCYSSVTKLEI